MRLPPPAAVSLSLSLSLRGTGQAAWHGHCHRLGCGASQALSPPSFEQAQSGVVVGTGQQTRSPGKGCSAPFLSSPSLPLRADRLLPRPDPSFPPASLVFPVALRTSLFCFSLLVSWSPPPPRTPSLDPTGTSVGPEWGQDPLALVGWLSVRAGSPAGWSPESPQRGGPQGPMGRSGPLSRGLSLPSPHAGWCCGDQRRSRDPSECGPAGLDAGVGRSGLGRGAWSRVEEKPVCRLDGDQGHPGNRRPQGWGPG